ncbi:endoplasmic reticulum protein [Coprinopsis marcescibilis]|uniref:ER membrane protein complex subunit 4 n=1 Tax=Coprinopsis marcescibilis TaxID=230819 RepID=A0A5C3KZT8_COPMA|nr:endoplasmic reticulum protein [Coprinopsis marcescibilis]
MSPILEYSSLEPSNQTIVRSVKLPPPPGFTGTKASSSKAPVKKTAPTKQSYDAIKAQRAWDFATSPAKQLPMQAFMLYMSGSGVQIFSMGIVFMLLMTPFKNVFSMNDAFAQFAPSTSKNSKSISTLPLQKLVYIACNLLTLGVGLWKCRSMGLLPTGTGDWLAFETRGPPPEVVLHY